MENYLDSRIQIQNKILSSKLSHEYFISCSDYPENIDSVDIILSAYKKANDLFNPDSSSSIATFTLLYYIERIDDILNETFADLNDFKAISILFPMAINIQSLINEGPEKIKSKFSSELVINRDYYRFFEIDYYLELSRTNGIESAIKELEDDINIKANTYYKFAYNTYIQILPFFEEAILV